KITVGKVSTIQTNASMIASEVTSMRQEYGVDKVNIVAHSKGGLDSREYIRNNDDIGKLVMMGTPNGGSPIADAAQGLIPLFTGPVGSLIANLSVPSGYQLTTVHMALYNSLVGRNSNTEYVAMAGNWKPSQHWWQPSGAWYIPGEDDDFIQKSSVHALNYSQNLEYVSYDEYSTHSGLYKSIDIYNDLIGYVDQLTSQPGTQEPVEPPILLLSSTSPEQLQRMHSTIGEILTGETKTHDFEIINEEALYFNCMWGEGDLNVTLISPSGVRIDSAAAEADSSLFYSNMEVLPSVQLTNYSVTLNPEPGTWQIEVVGTNVPATGSQYAVGAMIQGSPIQMEALTDKNFYHNGEPITITATINENATPLTGVTVETKIALPDDSRETIVLHDDGANGDATADDGLYTGTFVNTSGSGLYRMLVEASSGAINRETTLLVNVAASESYILGSINESPLDSDGNGYYDALEFEIGVSTPLGNTYVLAGSLIDGSGVEIAHVSLDTSLSAGQHSIVLSVDGFDIYAHGQDGPYYLEQVVLAEETSYGPAIVDILESAKTTSAYGYRQFQRPDIYFTGVSSESGTDSDGNGQYDLLTVELEVDISVSDYYRWSANLLDPDGEVIDYAASARSLSTGINTIILTFDGTKIGEHGVNGPYAVSGLLMFGNSGINIVTGKLTETQAYNYWDFEGATPPLGTISGTIIGNCDDGTA
ncbi:MAG: alpha/beta hydrolase, partial [Candidatus Thorarchaeota archaeon]|nr:alpha/beta hydrolase [Candidatus Thorarchaeota archaeon]